MVASSRGGGGAGQGVMGRNGKDEALTAQGQGIHAFGQQGFGDHADGQIGLSRGEGFECSRQDFITQAQACRRFEGEEGFAQFEQGGPIDDAVHRQGELGFPAGGNPFHPVCHRVQFVQQACPFPQKFPACRRQSGMACAAVEEQHVEGILNLPHPVGEGAGHHASSPGRRCKAAGFFDALQHGEGVRREHIPGRQVIFRHDRMPSFILFE